MARYMLIGALGGPNFGDEMMLLAWIDAIIREDKHAEIFCDGYNLSNVKKVVGTRANVLKIEESIWAATYKVLNTEVGEVVWNDIQSCFEFLATANWSLECLEQLSIKKIDQIHIIGGGYLNSLWRNNYIILIMARLLGWQTGARVVATGLGLTPYVNKDAAGLLSVLNTFDIVDVRDITSYDLLSSNGLTNVSFSGDDALYYFEYDLKKPVYKLEVPSLVICIQNDLFPGQDIADACVSDEVLSLLERKDIRHIMLVAACETDVQRFSTERRKVLSNRGFVVKIIKPFELLKLGFPVSKDGLVITSRYHPHLFASLDGARGLAVSSNPYYDIKHSAVRNMGGNWPVVAIDGIQRIHEYVSNLLNIENLSPDIEKKEYFLWKKKQIIGNVTSLPSNNRFFPLNLVEAVRKYIQYSERRDRVKFARFRENLIWQRSTLSAERANNASLRIQLGSLNRNVEHLLAEIRTSKQQVSLLGRESENRKIKLERMENSLSWRLTGPLRWLSSKIRKQKH